MDKSSFSENFSIVSNEHKELSFMGQLFLSAYLTENIHSHRVPSVEVMGEMMDDYLDDVKLDLAEVAQMVLPKSSNHFHREGIRVQQLFGRALKLAESSDTSYYVIRTYFGESIEKKSDLLKSVNYYAEVTPEGMVYVFENQKKIHEIDLKEDEAANNSSGGEIAGLDDGVPYAQLKKKGKNPPYTIDRSGEVEDDV